MTHAAAAFAVNTCSYQKVYRHDPVGLEDVDFAALPSGLAEIGHEARPMLEVISTLPQRCWE